MAIWAPWPGCVKRLLLLQGFTEDDKWFHVAVKVAREFMKSHIISSDSDRIAVVFYGTVCLSRSCGCKSSDLLASCHEGMHVAEADGQVWARIQSCDRPAKILHHTWRDHLCLIGMAP